MHCLLSCFRLLFFFKLIRLTNKEKSKSFGMNLLLHAILKSFANNNKFGKCIKLKSFCATRWTCRLEAVKSVHCQILRILLPLKQCSNEKDSKTSIDALGLFVAVCDFHFLLGLEVLKYFK